MEHGSELLESWVGKLVALLPAGQSEPWVALLEGWDEHGIVLRYREEDIRADEESMQRQWTSLKPSLIFFPWPQVSFVAIPLEDLDEG